MSRCNLGQCITPNHFNVRDFEPFEGLSLDAEFDLVAPICVYYGADLRYKPQAFAAMRRLKALSHPLMATEPGTYEVPGHPADFAARYNALMMALAEEEIPGIESYIDPWGAFSFRVPGDACVLAGDACGTFAYYLNAALVRRRLEQARETSCA
jgi:hypothetical protein